jgi:hypothetical protein
MKTQHLVMTIIVAVSLAACSGPKPILYPNDHFRSVGKDTADEDIAQCRRLAEDAGAHSRGRQGRPSGRKHGRRRRRRRGRRGGRRDGLNSVS